MVVVTAALIAVAFFVLAQSAKAGYVIQPASGSTITSSDPTFLVYLDSSDSFATVYVANSTRMSSYGSALDSVGSCTPSTPFGEPNKFTCRPGYYSGGTSGKLAPGTYYWWMSYTRRDPEHPYGASVVSGPYQFTVAAPTAPSVSLASPAPGATVLTSPTFRVALPASASATVHVSDTSSWNSYGDPNGSEVGSCSIRTSTAGDYTCTDSHASYLMTSGSTYYWWVTAGTTDSGNWIYGPQSFVYREPTTGGSSGGGSGGGSVGGGGTRVRTRVDAPYLPSVNRWTGNSAKHSVLSGAVYKFSKQVGHPHLLSVACWSDRDWPSVSLNDDPIYSTMGLFWPAMPRWIHLSPMSCRSLQTLMTHRPLYPNRFVADGVDTLTHEMIHATFGVTNEAMTECYSMQETELMALDLKVPYSYSKRLGRLTLQNYLTHPARYVDLTRCRENGAWDLYKNQPSPPWHDFRV